MPPTSDGRPFFLFDATVLYAGLIGRGASSTILSTVQLGGMSGCTVENAIEETRIHLMAYFNAPRLKLHATETDRMLKHLREAPFFEVHPWITPAASLLPENRKDAYLLAAAEQYKPHILLTFDREVLAIGQHGKTLISRPDLVIEVIDELDLQP